MSIQEKPLSPQVAQRVRKFPCDGIPRYAVKGAGGNKQPMPYSDAWDALFLVTGCQATKKSVTYSVEGLCRLGELNHRHLAIARVFVSAKLNEENAKLERAVEAAVRLKARGVALPAETGKEEREVLADIVANGAIDL